MKFSTKYIDYCEDHLKRLKKQNKERWLEFSQADRDEFYDHMDQLEEGN